MTESKIEKKKSITPWSGDESCKICNVAFSLNLRRKTCAFCGELVCKNHSVKKV